MSNKIRMLVLVRDVSQVRELADLAFEGYGYDLTTAPDIEEALGRMTRDEFDIVIADLVKLADPGLEGLKRAKKKRPGTEVLLQSDSSGVFLAVNGSGRLTARDLCALEDVARRVA